MARQHVISHPSQLNSLSALPFIRTNGLGQLTLGGSAADHAERKRWEAELNRYYYACGCHASAVGLILGLVGGSGVAVYAYLQGSVGIGIAILIAVATAIAGAVLGKVFGQFRAHANLKRIVREIQGTWQLAERPDREQWTCG